MKKDKKGIILFLGLFFGAYFLYRVRAILLPFVLAALLAYLLEPLIRKLVDRGMPRMGALIFVVGVLIAFFGFVFVTFIPAMISELDILTDKLPYYIKRLEELIVKINRHYQKVDIPPTLALILDRIIERAQEFSLQFIERTTQVILDLLSRMFTLVMAPILAFYILKDLEEIKEYLWSLLPPFYRKEVKQLLIRIDKGIFNFFKGQLIVSILVVILSTLGLIWLEVKFSLLMGVLAGIFNMIPYFGPFFSALPPVFIALFTSPELALKVIILFTIIQQIEGSIISPKIMGEELGLHPVMIIFSLLAGGELLGILGMIIAIPVATIIKELLHYILVSVDNT